MSTEERPITPPEIKPSESQEVSIGEHAFSYFYNLKVNGISIRKLTSRDTGEIVEFARETKLDLSSGETQPAVVSVTVGRETGKSAKYYFGPKGFLRASLVDSKTSPTYPRRETPQDVTTLLKVLPPEQQETILNQLTGGLVHKVEKMVGAVPPFPGSRKS